ncbi:protein EPIDERMAL PATTERNING FACTOR 2-like [Chenopodium quinoa]|uniref:protein EPIDERMAL PATTERNING FACTOR 2-like n=1 Tax=Chenopodium quinoa TaxID=63459 RepID=UPI000B797D57|nr:protein EPIDERMAL PATTERNING FACTOR 2-like [Chenopodium quinoa]
MKFSLGVYKYYMLVLLMLVLLTAVVTTHSKPKHYMSAKLHKRTAVNEDQSYSNRKGLGKEELGREVYPMGSSLPDCSHACGVCSPCKRVMVSFRCASESCPIVYRCMCNGKFFHVPSN